MVAAKNVMFTKAVFALQLGLFLPDSIQLILLCVRVCVCVGWHMLTLLIVLLTVFTVNLIDLIVRLVVFFQSERLIEISLSLSSLSLALSLSLSSHSVFNPKESGTFPLHWGRALDRGHYSLGLRLHLIPHCSTKRNLTRVQSSNTAERRARGQRTSWTLGQPLTPGEKGQDAGENFGGYVGGAWAVGGLEWRPETDPLLQDERGAGTPLEGARR